MEANYVFSSPFLAAVYWNIGSALFHLCILKFILRKMNKKIFKVHVFFINTLNSLLLISLYFIVSIKLTSIGYSRFKFFKDHSIFYLSSSMIIFYLFRDKKAHQNLIIRIYILFLKKYQWFIRIYLNITNDLEGY